MQQRTTDYASVNRETDTDRHLINPVHNQGYLTRNPKLLDKLAMKNDPDAIPYADSNESPYFFLVLPKLWWLSRLDDSLLATSNSATTVEELA